MHWTRQWHDYDDPVDIRGTEDTASRRQERFPSETVSVQVEGASIIDPPNSSRNTRSLRSPLPHLVLQTG